MLIGQNSKEMVEKDCVIILLLWVLKSTYKNKYKKKPDLLLTTFQKPIIKNLWDIPFGQCNFSSLKFLSHSRNW